MVSRPPTDGRPRQCLVFSGTRAADCLSLHGLMLVLTASEDGTQAARRRQAQHVRQRKKRDLTFDMSGGPKGAKRPLARPLDGGVRFHGSDSTFAFSRSNSCWVRAPLSSNFLSAVSLSYLPMVTVEDGADCFAMHSNTSSTRGKFPRM